MIKFVVSHFGVQLNGFMSPQHLHVLYLRLNVPDDSTGQWPNHLIFGLGNNTNAHVALLSIHVTDMYNFIRALLSVPDVSFVGYQNSMRADALDNVMAIALDARMVYIWQTTWVRVANHQLQSLLTNASKTLIFRNVIEMNMFLDCYHISQRKSRYHC